MFYFIFEKKNQFSDVFFVNISMELFFELFMFCMKNFFLIALIDGYDFYVN